MTIQTPWEDPNGLHMIRIYSVFGVWARLESVRKCVSCWVLIANMWVALYDYLFIYF